MDAHSLPTAFYFQVSIDDDVQPAEAVFQEVDGIEARLDTAYSAEGNENRFAYQLPGRSMSDTLLLKRGVLSVQAKLVNWCRNTLEVGLGTQVEIKDMTISLIDHEGVSVVAWKISGAYPVKWQVATFRAEEEKLVVEAIELAYAFVTRIT